MGDAADDIERFMDMIEDDPDNRIRNSLRAIIECEKSSFKDERHMINYMKKIARSVLKELEEY